MDITRQEGVEGYEEVVRARDEASGLDAYIAIHNSSRGPGLGGCRMWQYADDAEALEDVLRLSRGMTYKSALADIPYGGGKSLIRADIAGDRDRTKLMQAMARFVAALEGRYVIAEDVGTSTNDMAIIAKETSFVSGLENAGGDPSEATAWGVFHGIGASLEQRLGHRDWARTSVAIQGLGHVGWHLARMLREAGANLSGTDVNEERVAAATKEFDLTPVDLDAIFDLEVDVLAPCALGAIVNDDAIGRLKATIIAGSANNQLAEDRHGDALQERGILYAPDYAINAGGVINIHHSRLPEGYDHDRAFEHTARIGNVLTSIYKRAEQDGISTAAAADRVAETRFQ